MFCCDLSVQCFFLLCPVNIFYLGFTSLCSTSATFHTRDGFFQMRFKCSCSLCLDVTLGLYVRRNVSYVATENHFLTMIRDFGDITKKPRSCTCTTNSRVIWQVLTPQTYVEDKTNTSSSIITLSVCWQLAQFEVQLPGSTLICSIYYSLRAKQFRRCGYAFGTFTWLIMWLFVSMC